MTKVHRALFSQVGAQSGVALNTPYGFQANVDQMTDKILTYFDVSLQADLTPLDLRSVAKASPEAIARFKHAVATAPYVFAGPGSPSYALDQWEQIGLDQDLTAVVVNGGALCFSSAAALTLGATTIPVYEIYKAGAEATWLPGLNVLANFGLHCAVIPHFNNAEGGTYDTSRCYIGEARLQELEAMLPAGTGVLGIDEHTAAVIDFDARTLTVSGKGDVTWRKAGSHVVFHAGDTVSLDDLGAATVPVPVVAPVEAPEDTVSAAELAVRDARDQAMVAAIDQIRSAARAEGNYAIADGLRDALAAFGVAVRDSAIAPKA